MTDKGLVLGSIIVAGGMIISSVLLRPPKHPHPLGQSAPAVSAPLSAAQIRQAYIQGFIEQVTARTPALGYDQEIVSVKVQAIDLSHDGAILTITPRIMWTKRGGRPTEYPCRLRSDGLGGFVGDYAPMSDNRKEISIRLTADRPPTR